MRSSSLFSALFKDEEIVNNITVGGNNGYGMTDALLPGQDKQVQFET